MRIRELKLKIPENGFTLVEILVILAILAVVFGISTLALKNISPNMQLSGITRQLVTDFRYAEQVSVTKQINHGIVFSTSTSPNEYQVVKYGEGGEISEVLKTEEFPPKVSIEEINFDNNKVAFNPYGAAVQGGNIVLINSKGETRVIKVSPAGFVKVSK